MSKLKLFLLVMVCVFLCGCLDGGTLSNEEESELPNKTIETEEKSNEDLEEKKEEKKKPVKVSSEYTKLLGELDWEDCKNHFLDENISKSKHANIATEAYASIYASVETEKLDVFSEPKVPKGGKKWCGEISDRFEKINRPDFYVYDNLLKGYWSRSSNYALTYNKDHVFSIFNISTNQNATDFCKSFGPDFRIPTIAQLESLTTEDHDEVKGFINGEVFDDNVTLGYWSNTPFRNIHNYFIFKFDYGLIDVSQVPMKEITSGKYCDYNSGMCNKFVALNNWATNNYPHFTRCFMPSEKKDIKKVTVKKKTKCRKSTINSYSAEDDSYYDTVRWCDDEPDRFVLNEIIQDGNFMNKIAKSKTIAEASYFIYDKLNKGYWSQKLSEIRIDEDATGYQKAEQDDVSFEVAEKLCKNFDGGRLPTIGELTSLTDRVFGSQHYFGGIELMPRSYWSSTNGSSGKKMALNTDGKIVEMQTKNLESCPEENPYCDLANSVVARGYVRCFKDASSSKHDVFAGHFEEVKLENSILRKCKAPFYRSNSKTLLGLENASLFCGGEEKEDHIRLCNIKDCPENFPDHYKLPKFTNLKIVYDRLLKKFWLYSFSGDRVLDLLETCKKYKAEFPSIYELNSLFTRNKSEKLNKYLSYKDFKIAFVWSKNYYRGDKTRVWGVDFSDGEIQVEYLNGRQTNLFCIAKDIEPHEFYEGN